MARISTTTDIKRYEEDTQLGTRQDPQPDPQLDTQRQKFLRCNEKGLGRASSREPEFCIMYVKEAMVVRGMA
jgi:hypothetical protein